MIYGGWMDVWIDDELIYIYGMLVNEWIDGIMVGEWNFFVIDLFTNWWISGWLVDRWKDGLIVDKAMNLLMVYEWKN